MIFSDCVKVDEILYAFSAKRNLLIKFNMNNKDASIAGSIPKEALDSQRLVAKLLLFEDQILLVPNSASDIWIYTLKTREWIQIEFEEPKLELKFVTGFVYADKAYMIGCMYAGIAIYDFKKKELKYFKNLHKIWKQNHRADIFCRDYTFMGESNILIPSCRSNEIAELNLETLEIMIHKVGDAANRFESILFLDGHCWITPRKGNKIIIWNMENEIKLLDTEIDEARKGCHYCGIIAYSNQVSLLAYNDAKGLSCDFFGNIIRKTDDKFLFCHKHKDSAITQARDETIWIIEDNNFKKISPMDIMIEGLFTTDKNFLYVEDRSHTLSRYLDLIK